VQPGRWALSESSRIAIILFVVRALGVGPLVVPSHAGAGLSPAVFAGGGGNPPLDLNLPVIVSVPGAPELSPGPGSPPTEVTRPDSVRVACLLVRGRPSP
jgi:hypothetical protein